MLKLYSYYRSSAAYRVRIALHIKHVPFEYVPVHLVEGGGRQHDPAYARVNPMRQVPAIDDDGFCLGESLAILRYLEARHPLPPLWPTEAAPRARVDQICETINAGIQPLINLKVTRALESDFGLAPEETRRWTTRWLEDGLAKLEQILVGSAGRYAMADAITAADCLVVPQCFSARRFGVDVDQFKTLARVDLAARELTAFTNAEPSRQPDAE